jgi:hypothetical protein
MQHLLQADTGDEASALASSLVEELKYYIQPCAAHCKQGYELVSPSARQELRLQQSTSKTGLISINWHTQKVGFGFRKKKPTFNSPC